MRIDIQSGDLADTAVQALLQEHLAGMAEHSPAESIHALPIAGLAADDISFWCAWQGPTLAGCGALKELTPEHGEIKSMRTAAECLRQGVAEALLQHIVEEAMRRGYRVLSLETGSGDAFQPAHRLYRKCGFDYCGPFGDYQPDPFSVFMRRSLSAVAPGRVRSLAP